MPQYPYRPELKPPKPLGGIDFGNPALAPVIRMVVQPQRQAARSWHPPEGLSVRRISVPSRDGAAVECFVVEPETGAPLPGLLYCHGGGFFLPLEVPALELAAVYAQKLGVRVFLPEYRLLPEHPFPAPLQDCRTVWEEMGKTEQYRLDGRALLYGESAGGALAAGLAQQLRDEGEPSPCGQILIYPALDDRSERYPSTEAYSGAVWSKQANARMWGGYLKNGFQGPEGHAVPLRAGGFSNLPPAYIEPQGIDLLRDEAAAYGGALRAAGVPAQVNIIEGSYHGFDADVGNPFVQKVVQSRIAWMSDLLNERF